MFDENALLKSVTKKILLRLEKEHMEKLSKLAIMYAKLSHLAEIHESMEKCKRYIYLLSAFRNWWPLKKKKQNCYFIVFLGNLRLLASWPIILHAHRAK